MADGSIENSAKKAKKLKTAHSTVVGSPPMTNSLDDSDMIMNYEKRIAEMLMTI